jgi:NTP pyrophosphatase (non-canonical NTP hydrolase)
MRQCVLKLAELMNQKLDANSAKGGWDECTTEYLCARLAEEVGELIAVAIRDRGLPPSARRAAIAGEAADVANFAMMIADNAGGLP